MDYYKTEFDTGGIIDEKTGKRMSMLTVCITVAEYRDLVARAAKNEAARLADDYWAMKKENIDLRAELSDLRHKLDKVKEAEE